MNVSRETPPPDPNGYESVLAFKVAEILWRNALSDHLLPEEMNYLERVPDALENLQKLLIKQANMRAMPPFIGNHATAGYQRYRASGLRPRGHPADCPPGVAMTMLEKAALAMKARLGEQLQAKPLLGDDRSGDWYADGGSIDLTDLFAVGLRAIREPDEAMVDAAVEVRLYDVPVLHYRRDAELLFPAMIDAILAEGK